MQGYNFSSKMNVKKGVFVTMDIVRIQFNFIDIIF